ncbi:Glutamyl-tRNA synthetase [Phlyctochytrium planicorne]|nr:Glutamyl-tRNA synthetase [Phlyctochytrium planicorne]
MSKTVVRFAPSPTGYLHLGGLRTALFNYLFAKKHDGKFILRLEDTDQDLTSVDRMDHISRYLILLCQKADANDVSPKEPIYIETMQKRSYLYLSSREISEKSQAGNPYAIRMKVANSSVATKAVQIPEGRVSFKDGVYGSLTFRNEILDDSILFKTDGQATYHLANVVDDKLMGVTHVLRGEEWLPSTPKHLLLYSMFNWNAPQFLHLPLLMNKDGSKLSKRQSDLSLESIRKQGISTDALLTFAASMGLSLPSSKTFTLSELVKEFSVDRLQKAPAIVSYDRLLHLNKTGLVAEIETNEDAFLKRFQDAILERFTGLEDNVLNKQYLKAVLDSIKERARTFAEIISLASPFLKDPDLNSPESREMRSEIADSDYCTKFEI